ncbi:MAG TPA: hypothetical protein VH877_32560 [Polyangia bacterium]|jgi:hypothetical protein|nr:hypothetical protein [Polyangia bacterium]
MIDPYNLALGEGGKLKMRATALLAEGGAENRFEAAVLFHAAARAERRALDSLEEVERATSLAAVIEICWCHLEGFDPTGAARVRGEVLEHARGVSADLAGAMSSRLEVRFRRELAEFSRLFHNASALGALRPSGTFIAPTVTERRRVRREILGLLDRFPGIPHLWWAAYRNAEADEEVELAWDSLRRAHRLDPLNPAFEAISLTLAPRVLAQPELSKLLAASFHKIQSRTAAPELCLQYALAEILLAKSHSDPEGLARARLAVDVGQAQQMRRERVRQYLQATRLLLEEKSAGRQPTIDILFRAGLGDVVPYASAKPSPDIVSLMTQGAQQAVSHLADDKLAA